MPIRSSSSARTRRARPARCTSDGAITLGVDTTVHLDGRLYGKPADRDEARAMLGELAGATHLVVSGLCLLGPGFAVVEHAVTARHVP